MLTWTDLGKSLKLKAGFFKGELARLTAGAKQHVGQDDNGSSPITRDLMWRKLSRTFQGRAQANLNVV
jgi:hypothetical protein